MDTVIGKVLQKQMRKDKEISDFVTTLQTRAAPLTREQLSSSGFHLESKYTSKKEQIWTIRANAGDRVVCEFVGNVMILVEFFTHDQMIRFLRRGSVEEDILVEAMKVL